jgi:F0F1-type ATP synthase assembly protein I
MKNPPHRQVAEAIDQGWVAGGSFFGSIMAGLLIGWIIDNFAGTYPAFVVVGIIVGSISGFIQMWALANKGSRIDQ